MLNCFGNSAVLIVLASFLVGCGPAVTLAPPEDWPAEWSQRTIYSTPHAYIYASSASGASQADRAAKVAAQEFCELTGYQPSKAILIVNDAGDQLIVEDKAQLLRLIMQFKKLPNASMQDYDRVAGELETAIQKLSELGIGMDMFFQVQPMAITSQQLVDLGLPAGHGAWGAVVPTNELMYRFLISTIEEATRNEEEMTVGKKMILASMMPLIRAKLGPETTAKREVIVFSQLASNEDKLSQETKTKLIKDFQQARDSRNASGWHGQGLQTNGH